MALIQYAEVDPRLWSAVEHGLFPRRFALWREADPSGVSGCGLVALGVQFPDGKCVIRWQGPPYSEGRYRSMRAVIDVHGHHGDTIVLWFDKE